MQCEDGHLQMPLPFKERLELPNNRCLTAIRLKHLQQKMEKDERFQQHYLTFMEEMIECRFVEQSPKEAPHGSINYIPQHSMYH